MTKTEKIDSTPQEVECSPKRPSRREVLEAIRAQPKVVLDRPVADIIREERERR